MVVVMMMVWVYGDAVYVARSLTERRAQDSKHTK